MNKYDSVMVINGVQCPPCAQYHVWHASIRDYMNDLERYRNAYTT